MRMSRPAALALACLTALAHAQSTGVERLPPIEELIPGGAAAGRQPATADPLPEFEAFLPGAELGGAQVTLDPLVIRRHLLRALIVARLVATTDPRDFGDEERMVLLEAAGEINWGSLPAGLLEVDDELAALIELDRALTAKIDNNPPSSPSTVPTRVSDAQLKLLDARVAHDIDMLAERASVIRTTNLISWIICGVAHFLLLIGLWAALIEFMHATQTRKRAPDASEVAAAAQAAAAGDPRPEAAAEAARAVNEIKVSLEGVALKTALHGLLILCLAMGFYYLYLRFVYPITVVGG